MGVQAFAHAARRATAPTRMRATHADPAGTAARHGGRPGATGYTGQSGSLAALQTRRAWPGKTGTARTTEGTS